jgi:hypothetical protein
MTSAFGIDHDSAVQVSKRETSGFKRDKKLSGSEATAAAAGATGTAGVAAAKTSLPEHSHYSRKTRKYLKSLPAGEHEVDTKMLAKRPRKLGARKQQTPYVAAMAQERPLPYSPVPITRYKDGIIQRDNAHSVMANAMKGRKTTIKLEDAPGFRPRRKTGEELVRRGQMKFQEQRLKRNFNLPEKKIEQHRGKYKASSRAANTHTRPHGVVEEKFKYADSPYTLKRAIKQGKNLTHILKADRRDRDTLAGATGVAGAGVLASTPVRRSAKKVDIKDGSISSKDAKKIVNPGYRPGNKKAIKTMAANLGHLENSPTKVIQYADGRVIPFDGNHRATARIARGDKRIPVSVIEGGERPAISVTRNAYHAGKQRVHRGRMAQKTFAPETKVGTRNYTGKHTAEPKIYSAIANGSGRRSAKRVAISSTRVGAGPTAAVLRTKQAATVGAGTALLGTAAHLKRKKDRDG